MQRQPEAHRESANCRWRKHAPRFIAAAAFAVACGLAIAPASAQSVTFGGPLVGGEVTTQIGGVVVSSPLPAVKASGGVATNKLGRFYITDSESNAVYTFIQVAPGTTPEFTQLNFSGLNGPGEIAVDGQGDVYVADTKNFRIAELTAGGNQQSIPVPQSGYPLGVAVDASGNLYFSAGFAYNNPGAVFKLAAGSKTPVQIGAGLVDPKGLAVDPAGNLFIADYDNQRIVEISASGTQTTALSLPDFPSHVAVDNRDDIYTDQGGYVIQVKAGTTDQVAVLPQVLVPYSGLAVDGDGNIFAAQGMAGNGAGPTLYESSTEVISLPNANVCQAGGNASSGCTSSVTLPFWIWSSVDLGAPGLLTQGVAGLDFAQDTSAVRSCAAGQVTLPPNAAQICNVVVNFTPQAAGPRKGALQIVDSTGKVLVQLQLFGIGIGPQLSIAADGVPPAASTVPLNAGNQTPSTVGVDAAGNLFVTASRGGSNVYTSSVYRIDPSGNQTTIPIANIFSPGRAEIDGVGDLFLPAGYADYEFPPSGSATAPAPLIGNLHGSTEGLSPDGHGNATLVTDNFGLGSGVIYRSTLDGSLIPIASSSTNDEFGDVVDDPWLMTVDTGLRYDSPIVADGSTLVEASPFEQSLVPFLDLQTLSTGFSIPQGSGTLGIGPGGDIFFGTESGIYDTLGRSLFTRSDVFTLDASGNLFVILPAQGNQPVTVAEVRAIQHPFAFPATTENAVSSPQAFTVFNGGNAQMDFTSIGITGPFNLSGKTCSTSLEPGTSCSISVTFNPVAPGSASGALGVAVAGLVTPTFTLTGNGTGSLIGTSTSLMPNPSSPLAGSPLTLSAVVTAASGLTPQGTVTFNSGNSVLGTQSLDGSGHAALTFTPQAGAYTFTAGYGGSSTDASSTSAALNLTVAPGAPAATTTSLAISPNPAAFGSAVNFNVAVAAQSGAPTGTVTINDGANALAQFSLSAGAGSYSTSSLAAGSHSLTAVYSGDGAYQASTSSSATLTISPVGASIAPTTSTTVSAGGSVSANVSITAASNFSGFVSLSCTVSFQGKGSATGLPACGVNPPSLSLSAGAPASATLTVTTTAQSTAGNASPGRVSLAGVALLLLLVRRRARLWLSILCICAFSFAISGCSPNNTTPDQTPPPANPGTSPGSYVVTLSTSTGSVTTTQSFTVNV